MTFTSVSLSNTVDVPLGSVSGPRDSYRTGDYRIVPEDRRQAELFPIRGGGE